MSALPSVRPAEAAPSAEATRVLYERYADRILAYCVSRLGSRHEAEDAMQTTFLNAFRSLQSGVIPQYELAWLFRIAENVCRDGYKSASRRRRLEATKDLQEVQDTLSAPLRNDGLDGVADALSSMPERQRRAILLREWQGLSYGEIASKLGLSGSAVETLIFRARRSLARALEEGRRRASAFDVFTLLSAAKSALQGGAAAAAKVAIPIAAAGGAALVATVPLADQARHPVRGGGSQAEPALTSGREPVTTRPASGTSVQRAPKARLLAPPTKARGSAAESTRRPRGGESATAMSPTLGRAPVDERARPTVSEGVRTESPPPRGKPVATPVTTPPVSPPPVGLPNLPVVPDPPPLVPPPPPPDLPVGLPPPPPLPDLPVGLPPPPSLPDLPVSPPPLPPIRP